MKLNRPYILYIFICLWLLFLPSYTNHLWGKDFVVVIDAGHGGHDPGAIGKISKEKNINLNVALKVGNLIKRNCDDVKVIYTRSKDVFIPLDRRAEIANNAKADLFISIHTNALANNRTAKGASTWTLGLAKSDANLEVAKRENSVILYESDYKTRYAGFNPNSAESYIIFEFMQDKYMEQSVHLASLMQKQFRQTCRRADRGVHQAGFLVLKASAMPSILIELGFISTPEEERYLNSEEGAGTMAKGIYRAFLNYKREHELRLTGVSRTIVPTEQEEDNAPAIAQKDTESVNTAPQQEKLLAEAKTKPAATAKTAPKRPIVVESATNDSEITFKIQILTSSKPLAKNDKRLKGLKEVDYYKEGGIYKYTYGASADYNKVLRTKRTITAQFKDAFIIAFRNGEKMNVNEAIAEFKKRRNK
ncbi:N-acetylmuramoyl-L-alanine amidase [Bacteroides ovatus]|uniref:N-acetylmuramoyl-L-alanine amidase family protein n=1 Tax=Bacteroides ovatus TaxID=28116 RepID=UPI00298E5D63|nr:N-acetylmuramoyl-L-alanine amidase [Bacteroides ovatus]MDW7579031.1 N-acetylmuramoyl-L-alanine amidase [Bacteroides ovatus]